MSSEPSIPDRLRAGTPGLGAADNSEIEQRAMELAKIDGRTHFTDSDLARAAADLAGGSPESMPPEVDAPIVEELESWDAPVDEDGRQVPETGLEDEALAEEELISDGLDEADHSQRLAAADEAEDDQ